jgi:DNA-binding HxlR family transcriptional regulator
VARRSLLYMGILAELRGGLRTWSELKTSLEKRFKRTISNPQLANLLNTLAQLSLLEKDSRGYRALDPLVPEAAELLLRTHHR